MPCEIKPQLTQTALYNVSKLQEYVVQHQEYSQYFIVHISIKKRNYDAQ